MRRPAGLFEPVRVDVLVSQRARIAGAARTRRVHPLDAVRKRLWTDRRQDPGAQPGLLGGTALASPDGHGHPRTPAPACARPATRVWRLQARCRRHHLAGAKPRCPAAGDAVAHPRQLARACLPRHGTNAARTARAAQRASAADDTERERPHARRDDPPKLNAQATGSRLRVHRPVEYGPRRLPLVTSSSGGAVSLRLPLSDTCGREGAATLCTRASTNAVPASIPARVSQVATSATGDARLAIHDAGSPAVRAHCESGRADSKMPVPLWMQELGGRRAARRNCLPGQAQARAAGCVLELLVGRSSGAGLVVLDAG